MEYLLKRANHGSSFAERADTNPIRHAAAAATGARVSRPNRQPGISAPQGASGGGGGSHKTAREVSAGIIIDGIIVVIAVTIAVISVAFWQHQIYQRQLTGSRLGLSGPQRLSKATGTGFRVVGCWLQVLALSHQITSQAADVFLLLTYLATIFSPYIYLCASCRCQINMGGSGSQF